MQSSFVQQTNLAFSSLAGRTLQIQNINTNETVTVAYGYIFSGSGLTNVWIAVTNQYSFPASNGWVNGATFTTNIPPASFTVPVTPVGQINISSTYSNNVIFQ